MTFQEEVREHLTQASISDKEVADKKRRVLEFRVVMIHLRKSWFPMGTYLS